MQRAVAASICLTALCFAGCAGHSQAKAEKRADENAAIAVAQNWLEMLDAGSYEEAFEWEALDFRIWRTQKEFVRYMQARRQPFGKTLGRTAIGSAAMTKLVGVPEGRYRTVLFKT